MVAVQVDEQHHRGPLVLESDSGLEESNGLFNTALIRRGQARILISNSMGYMQKIQKGTQLDTAMRAKVVSTATEEIKTHALSDSSTTEEVTALLAGSMNGPQQQPATSSMEELTTDSQLGISEVSSQKRTQMRTEKLLQLLEHKEMDLPGDDKDKLYTLLAEQHQDFVLEEKERGETDLIQFHIDTDKAPPKKQPLGRTPLCSPSRSCTAAERGAGDQCHSTLDQLLGKPNCPGTEERWTPAVLH